MPNYIARPDIPEPLLKALISDAYEDSLDSHMESLPPEIRSKFAHTISVTTLARSPRQRILFKRHASEITMDPEDRFWAILGRTVHSILEQNKAQDDVVEERLGIVVPVVLGPKNKVDVYLHGQADRYRSRKKRIEDWKFTKAEAMLYNKEDHEAQLNVLGFIWGERGKPVESLGNTYLFRNWEARNVKEGSAYPEGRIKVKEVPVWERARIVEYYQKRLVAHISSESLPDDDLPFCTDAERWVSAPTFRVLKVDEATGEPQKIAKHTATSMIEAEDKVTELIEEDWEKVTAKNNKLAKPKPEESLKRASFVIQERKAQPRRCAFCEVREFCNQRRNELIEQAQATENNEPDDLP